MQRLRAWVRVASDGTVLRRALVTALVVGTILTLVNQWDVVLGGRLDARVLLQVGLTMLALLVVGISSVAAIQGQAADGDRPSLPRDPELEGAINFPDRNPNPVLRVATDGRLLYANASSQPIRDALGVKLGDSLPADVLAELTDAASATPPRSIEVRQGWQTFAVLPVPGPEFLNLYGTDITAARVVERFPDRNPNPVMRMSPEGTLLYCNAAGAPIVGALGAAVGEPLPVDLVERLRRSSAAPGAETVEVRGEGRTYVLEPVPIPEFGFINIYGTDVTALKAVDKFPDQNPNPVLRLSRDGRLTYGNPASAAVRKALGVEVGGPLPQDVFARIGAIVEADSRETIEVESDGRLFALLVVSVYEFASINIYGTDITAAREVEIAHIENERLLLNILPASIAQRLRQGEMVIADAFDEMTVLFADCVGFTQLSSNLTPAEVVEMLNAIFSVFDGLVDRHGLEKIKTIGDAYMVVGGLARDSQGQAELVAQMGLDMVGEVERYRLESGRDLHIRLGMHTGPAVAGVIGIKKFIYDVWGDTVNMASRMEASGVPDRIQVSEATYERLREAFEFQPRGTIEIKGKGALATYLLVDRRA